MGERQRQQQAIIPDLKDALMSFGLRVGQLSDAWVAGQVADHLAIRLVNKFKIEPR